MVLNVQSAVKKLTERRCTNFVDTVVGRSVATAMSSQAGCSTVGFSRAPGHISRVGGVGCLLRTNLAIAPGQIAAPG